jgi:hypothetical protein
LKYALRSRTISLRFHTDNKIKERYLNSRMSPALRLIRGQNLPFQYGPFPPLSESDKSFLKRYADRKWTEQLNLFWVKLIWRHQGFSLYENPWWDVVVRERRMAQVKELLEAIQALHVAYDTYMKVMEDDKIDIKDIKHLPELLAAVRTAVDGFKEIPGEVKDATPEELGAALKGMIELVRKVLGHV